MAITNPVSELEDENGNILGIAAKGLDTPVQISLTGDVSGSATTDFTSDPSISTTIGAKKVTTSKIDDSAVTTAKINDKAVTLDKIADAAKGGAVQDNDGVLATHVQVKNYVDAIVAGEGKYRGVQTVATINSWTVANLNNGDRVITADAGTITFNGQSLAVVADQELVLWKDTSTSPVTAVWQTSEGNYKLKQTAKPDPDVPSSGTTESLSFIDTIVQNPNGEMTATKKNMRSATTELKGIVQLAGSIGATVSTENNKAASEKAVRDAINANADVRFYTNTTDTQYYKIAECDIESTSTHTALTLDYWISRATAKSERGIVEISARPINGDGYGINHFVAYQEKKLGTINYSLSFMLTMQTSGDTTHLELWASVAQKYVGFFAASRFSKSNGRNYGTDKWTFIENPTATGTAPTQPSGGLIATASPSFGVKVASTSAVGSTSIPVYVDASGDVQPCTDDFVHDGDVAQTYSASSTAPISGAGVASAINSTSVRSVQVETVSNVKKMTYTKNSGTGGVAVKTDIIEFMTESEARNIWTVAKAAVASS